MTATTDDIAEKALDIILQDEPTAEQLKELMDSDALQDEVCRAYCMRTELLRRERPVDVEARLRRFHARHVRRRPWTLPLWLTASAAACLLAAFLLTRPDGDEPVVWRKPTVTAVQQGLCLTTEKGREVKLSPKTRQHAAVTLDDFQWAPGNEAAVERVTLTVPFGKSADITLPDGSIACLHPGSNLAFPTRFTGGRRRVRLKGEAYFKVVHDPAHPFVVEAGDMQTTVVGTEFNFDTRRREVTLVTGCVRVKDKQGGGEITVSPRQQVGMAEDGTLTVREADIDPYVFWRDGYLYFDNVELKDIMLAIGANFNRSVEFRGQEMMHLKMRFIVERNNGLDAALDAMNRMKKVRVSAQGSKIVVDAML